MNRTYIFCATKFEAAPFIGHFGLKQDRSDRILSLFVSEDPKSNEKDKNHCLSPISATGSILLAVTGVGPVAAAGTVARTLALFPPAPADCLLNIGCCAGPEFLPGSNSSLSAGLLEPVAAASQSSDISSASFGTFYRINAIRSAADGRRFYPDLLDTHPFSEAPLTSVASVAAEAPETLYDMEAAAIFQTARPFFSCDRMVFLKCPTDCGGDDLATLKAQAEKYYRPDEKVFSYIESLLTETTSVDSLSTQAPDALPSAAAFDLSSQLSADASLFCPSETMRHEIENLLKYAKFAGIDAEKIILEMKEEGFLPAKNRKDGKKALAEFRNKVRCD